MLSNVETGYHLNYNPEFQNIRGKAVVIIGDSAGIGRAVAGLLAGYGARIFFAARTSAELSSALSAVEQEGGEWDGIVVNLSQEDEIRRLFDLAWRRMGRIDVLVIPPAINEEGLQHMCMQEAIHRMHSGARIINIEMPDYFPKSLHTPSRSMTAALRREANEQGIHVTLMEPGTADYRDLRAASDGLDAKDVAQYVYESLTQPFGSDVIFVPGKFVGPAL